MRSVAEYLNFFYTLKDPYNMKILDKMVSHGQGNNRPQARLSESGQGQSQWIQQIMKHGEKYPTVVIRSAAGKLHLKIYNEFTA